MNSVMIDYELNRFTNSNEDLDFLFKLSKDVNENNTVSTESLKRLDSINKQYNVSNINVSTEVIGTTILLAIGAAIAAIFIFVYGLIKKLVNSGSNRVAAFQDAVKNGTNVSNVGKTKDNISDAVRQSKSTPIKDVNISKLSSVVSHDCAKSTTITAQAYKLYLELTRESIDGKTIEDMDKWLSSIRSSGGDVLKIVRRSFIENPTLKDKLTGDLKWLNYRNADFKNLISELSTIEDLIMKYADGDSYGSEWRGCVNAINNIETSINFMNSGRTRTDFSSTLEINISFVEKMMQGNKTEISELDSLISGFKNKGYDNDQKWKNIISNFETYLRNEGGSLDNTTTRENGWVSDSDSLTRMIFKRFSKAINDVCKLNAQRTASISRIGEYIIKSSEIAKKLSEVGDM